MGSGGDLLQLQRESGIAVEERVNVTIDLCYPSSNLDGNLVTRRFDPFDLLIFELLIASAESVARIDEKPDLCQESFQPFHTRVQIDCDLSLWAECQIVRTGKELCTLTDTNRIKPFDLSFLLFTARSAINERSRAVQENESDRRD